MPGSRHFNYKPFEMPEMLLNNNDGGGLAPALLKDLGQYVDEIKEDLSRLALDIHAHPELGWKEHYAHDRCTELMQSHGFKVTRHAFGLETAWSAELQVGQGGKTIGFNSEMDALQGLGHACGHNLIAMAGCAAAIATARLLERRDIAGRVVLLGTPAEEGGGSKCVMLERGAYDDMEACLMVHPGTHGNGAMVATTNCLAGFRIKFKGSSAHAAGAPEKGINALDAAVGAYVNISMLRQQTADKVRMHGTIKGCDQWSPNVIASEAEMIYAVRAPSSAEVVALIPRFLNCFKAAALATGCEIEIERDHMYMDVRPAAGLETYFNEVSKDMHRDDKDGEYEVKPRDFVGASTDFGDVSYHLPALHPMFNLPEAGPEDFPHSGSYAGITNLDSSIRATKKVALSIAAVGARVVIDEQFRDDVRSSWEAEMKACGRDELLDRIRKVYDVYPRSSLPSSGCCSGNDDNEEDHRSSDGSGSVDH